ncbi:MULTISPECIES: TadE/TadG family type IV pilus assembly protein [unclassified Paraburkholderia]|uniref:TadE/TadG family type IV pilus assembly protein n=1 Tax=unclassified Paraburkholderia TaxID=2615204 RepID=UPI002AAF1C7A|nr:MULTISPECIES: TadE/TadG family type IV pilus assembly protein [unclassified Paraburkholderia]
MRRQHQKGVVAVELAVAAPVLIAIVLGIAQFGWLLANSVMVASAASSAAQNFAFQRGTTTPYSSTQTQMTSSSTFLKSANLALTTTVNGSQCTSDTNCSTALTNGTGQAAAVTVAYTFTPLLRGSVFGLAAMPATLSTTVVTRVQ